MGLYGNDGEGPYRAFMNRVRVDCIDPPVIGRVEVQGHGNARIRGLGNQVCCVDGGIHAQIDIIRNSRGAWSPLQGDIRHHINSAISRTYIPGLKQAGLPGGG